MDMPANPRTVAIVQARMTSSRLPGKVLCPLQGKSVLWHVLTRAQAIPGVDLVCCATTEGRDADPLVAEAEKIPGVIVFRGSPDDVLDRYHQAARLTKADIVVRITSDCPLIDPKICGDLITLRAQTGADYASNVNPRAFPHGLDCEVFTAAILAKAAAQATAPQDREHVTPWIRCHEEVRQTFLIGPGWPAVEHRWTLDYPEDLAFFEALFAKLPPPPAQPGMQEILSVLAENPVIASLNAKRRIQFAPAGQRRPVAVFRFQATPEIGGGHAMRSSALASSLVDAGWRVLRMVDEATRAHLRFEQNDPNLILIEDSDIATAERLAKGGFRADLCLVDHYGLDCRFEQAARRFSERVLIIDDLADRQHDADFLVDATPERSRGDYASLLPKTAKTMLGPDFAILRAQFLQARRRAQNKEDGKDRIRRVVIHFGSIDRENGTLLALNAIAASALDLIVDVILSGRALHLP